MAFDYKKEYKEFYMPKNKPGIVEIPKMNYIAVRGKGNPNDEEGEYKKSIGLLYAVAFTIKMSYKGTHKIDGYFEYVVPPLEGFWWQEGIEGIDYSKKENFEFISVIRLPDFVSKDDFNWAVDEAAKKKKEERLRKQKEREERNKQREKIRREKELEREKKIEEARIEEELLVDNLYPKTKNNKNL